MNLSATQFIIVLAMGTLLQNKVISQVSSQEVDQLVGDAMSTFTTAGVAVAIVKDGQVIHKRGYGIKSVESQEKVDEHTNFAIASNTKAFTTAALAILVEEKKLSWEDKVVKHIPEFKMYDSYVTENFNIQDLLTHRSGLGLGAGDLMFFPSGGDFTIDDVIGSFKYFEPESAFRTTFAYDNLLYFVAGEIITRVSGMPWEQFIERHIFTPLNMDQSLSSYHYAKARSNIAEPHLVKSGNLTLLEPDLLDPNKINGAAGFIYSNVDDLTQWMLLHLNEGKYGQNLENELFSEHSQKEMWKIHTTLDVDRNPRYQSHFSGYGLGWFLTDLKGNMSVSHTGGLSGMLSRTVLIPDLELGIVVLTNSWIDGAAIFGSITRTLVDRYLGLEKFDWITEYEERFKASTSSADSVVAEVWQQVETADDAAIDKNSYIGIYEDRWFGKVEISIVDDRLWFKSLRSPKLSGALAFFQANAFAIKWAYPDMEADAFAIFCFDEKGKARSIKMKGISPNIDFSYDFQDLDLQRLSK